MKLYIFLTVDIHPIGGMQNYLDGKARFLRDHGWKVLIFYFGAVGGTCAMPGLNEYVSGGMEELGRHPEEWTRGIRNKALKKMADEARKTGISGDNIVIESQDDVTALWGELLAIDLQAKHMCFDCEELFRGPKKHYTDHMDFFEFKHRRRELTCIDVESMPKLFKGYKEVSPEECYHFNAANEGPIQDVYSAKAEQLKRYEWNICYFGRAEKGYVPIIIEEVGHFAAKHPEKDIQFIMIGEADEQKEVLQKELASVNNVTITLLGDMVPVPRAVFTKLDVVIAGSGCARCAAYENVPVIVADADNFRANGIYGYTTQDFLIHSDESTQMSYEDALEQVLVERIQEQRVLDLPELHPASYFYEKHMKFIEESVQSREYFDPINKSMSPNYIRVMKYYISHGCPWVAEMYRRMKK